VTGGRWVTLMLAAAAGLLPAACGGDGSDSAQTTACGTADEGNHDLAHPATFGPGGEKSGCLANGEPDVYLFQLEDGAEAGYLSFQLDGEALGQPAATLYGTDGDTVFGTVADGQSGAPMAFAVAAAPGAAYRLAIADAGGAGPYDYRLTATFTPVPDMYEPNDTAGQAAAITVGTPIQAYLFAGASAPNANLAAYDDYYRVPLAGGMVTVRLEDVPADLAPRIFIYSPDGSELGRVVTGHKGEPLTLQLPMSITDGEHVVRVTLWTETPATMSAATALPDHFVHPYRLTVTQR
jgi:hypothetical protein